MPGMPGSASARSDWLFWVILAGRGFGKTETGAQAVREWARNPKERILLIAPTNEDIEGTMIDGPSGLMSCYAPWESKPIYNAQKHKIEFPSGAIGITRSAEKPERLRGPQFKKFWFDEPCAAQYFQAAWDQIMFGFRMITPDLRGILTTTPKPLKLLKEIMAHPRTVVTRGSTDENRGNLSPEYIRTVIDPYRGTRLGRQEIEAELLEDVPGALWKRDMIDSQRVEYNEMSRNWDRVARIVIAIDPAVTAKEDSDETGIVVVALLQSRHAVVLEDRSGVMSANAWARETVRLYRKWRADLIIAEKNQGGDLVEMAIRNVDANVPYKGVHAKRGKYLRAEPVSMLYEQGRIHHVGFFPQLEDQMTQWTPQSDEDSPDRLDALVYGITELLIDNSPSIMTTQFNTPYEIT